MSISRMYTKEDIYNSLDSYWQKPGDGVQFLKDTKPLLYDDLKDCNFFLEFIAKVIRYEFKGGRNMGLVNEIWELYAPVFKNQITDLQDLRKFINMLANNILNNQLSEDKNHPLHCRRFFVEKFHHLISDAASMNELAAYLPRGDERAAFVHNQILYWNNLNRKECRKAFFISSSQMHFFDQAKPEDRKKVCEKILREAELLPQNNIRR
ncbi:MAG TPA: hypothetical protein VL360_05520 [Gammaproteobacteria bacterium]|nr:hypothetical protein [Gammaproteobacteria bacterium]